jgi:hypothetical protein
VMDVIFAFPGIVLAILLVSVLGAGLMNMLLAIAIFSVPVYARLAAGQCRLHGNRPQGISQDVVDYLPAIANSQCPCRFHVGVGDNDERWA